MKLYTYILPLCKDLALLLFSTLHLLLTRVLPLVAMILGSLLLHLTRFTVSLLFGATTSTPSGTRKSRRRVLQGKERAMLAEPVDVYEDAMQESLGIDDECAEYPMQEECYEDCQGWDDYLSGEQVRCPPRNPEEANQQWKWNVGDSGKGLPETDNTVNASFDEEGGDDVSGRSWQEPGDTDAYVGGGEKGKGEQVAGDDNARKEEVGDGLQEVDDVDEDVGDGSLGLPSDLPPTLDNVIMAAAVNNHELPDRAVTRGPLAPTFSTVAAAVQE